jgi:hypothetical protein
LRQLPLGGQGLSRFQDAIHDKSFDALGDQLGGNFQTLGFLHFHLWSDQLYAYGNDNKLIIYLSDF